RVRNAPQPEPSPAHGQKPAGPAIATLADPARRFHGSEIQSDAELRETGPERLVVHAEIRAAEDLLRPRVSIFVGVLQQVENLENELGASQPSETQPFRGSEIPREKPRLMKREPRQQ